MEFLRKLPIPKEIKEQYPIPSDLLEIKKQNDQEIKDILSGKSNKLLLIIGPCSADVYESVLEYGIKLKELQEIVKDNIKIIMRVFTNKPRTLSDGYMGMIHQITPSSKVDLLEGLIACRKLYIDLLTNTKLSLADELLYPQNYRYFSDILSYVTLGARSSLNQEHRLVASGLDIPVGVKNTISGSIKDLTSSIQACQRPHQFLYRGWEVTTKGNTLAHGIIRGYQDLNGNSLSNINIDYLNELCLKYQNNNFFNPSIIIDVNHDNSGKNYLLQIDNVYKGLDIKYSNKSLNKLIKGFMIESYLYDGKCDLNNKQYGVSITDSCLGFEKTKELVLEINKIINNNKI